MKKTPKNILGYVIILLAVLIVIGTLITIPNTLEAKTTGAMVGRLVGMVILFLVAFVLFRVGRKLVRVKKTEIEV
ncbi:hypothetical protein ACLI1A_14675 [Flavobacterium sp. RHBU_3]|uniref:hypothetical protein n=1 Tax=Flavobacterium sp. RHBU_3 TaxID=3391184 RepID=UPI003984F22D